MQLQRPDNYLVLPSSLLIPLFQRLCKQLIELRETETSPDGTPLQLSTQIDAAVILDRSVDWVTPMLTQLTYEGLLDETMGIKSCKWGPPLWSELAENEAFLQPTSRSLPISSATTPPRPPSLPSPGHQQRRRLLRLPRKRNTLLTRKMPSSAN